MMVRFDKNKRPFDEQEFRQDMTKFGDSLLVINDDEIVKVHVHSEHPGEVFNYGQEYGELIKVKAENMREQHRNVVNKEKKAENNNAEQVETAIIAISMGEGISEIFKSMGATSIINGGQTMNPSTEDIVKVMEQSGAKKAIILPNNKNIQMASDQAAEIVEADTVVIPTKSIPQGIAALFHYLPDAALEDNQATMTEALNDVVSGAITNAVRNTTIDGIAIKEGEFMGLKEGKIVASETTQLEAAQALLANMIDDDSEIVTVLTGEEAESETTEALTEWLEEEYPDVEVDEQVGDQPIYPYLFSVE